MGICPHCHQHSLLGHFYTKHWRIDLIIDDPDACDPLPVPFWAGHGADVFPERGKHALRLGYSCHQQAIDHAKNIFPEARIVQIVACGIEGEPLTGSDRCVIPGS